MFEGFKVNQFFNIVGNSSKLEQAQKLFDDPKVRKKIIEDKGIHNYLFYEFFTNNSYANLITIIKENDNIDLIKKFLDDLLMNVPYQALKEIYIKYANNDEIVTLIVDIFKYDYKRNIEFLNQFNDDEKLELLKNPIIYNSVCKTNGGTYLYYEVVEKLLQNQALNKKDVYDMFKDDLITKGYLDIFLEFLGKYYDEDILLELLNNQNAKSLIMNSYNKLYELAKLIDKLDNIDRKKELIIEYYKNLKDEELADIFRGSSKNTMEILLNSNVIQDNNKFDATLLNSSDMNEEQFLNYLELVEDKSLALYNANSKIEISTIINAANKYNIDIFNRPFARKYCYNLDYFCKLPTDKIWLLQFYKNFNKDSIEKLLQNIDDKRNFLGFLIVYKKITKEEYYKYMSIYNLDMYDKYIAQDFAKDDEYFSNLPIEKGELIQYYEGNNINIILKYIDYYPIYELFDLLEHRKSSIDITKLFEEGYSKIEELFNECTINDKIQIINMYHGNNDKLIFNLLNKYCNYHDKSYILSKIENVDLKKLLDYAIENDIDIFDQGYAIKFANNDDYYKLVADHNINLLGYYKGTNVKLFGELLNKSDDVLYILSLGDYNFTYQDLLPYIKETMSDIQLKEAESLFKIKNIELKGILCYFFKTNSNNINNEKIENAVDILQKVSEINIANTKLENQFYEYLRNNMDSLNKDRISDGLYILQRIGCSNASEILNFGDSLINQLLNDDNPKEKLNKIENIFLRNNLPTVGKIYSVFEILHPNLKGFDFKNSSISPILKTKSNKGRQSIIFADLMKASFGSNNRSIRDYLKSIEDGDNLFKNIENGSIKIEELSEEQKVIMDLYMAHLKALYNNTLFGKNNSIELTGDYKSDIEILTRLFKVEGYDNLPDRIIRMFSHFAGFDTFHDAKAYFESKSKIADIKHREKSDEFKLEQGDFVKGIGSIAYLGNILQNGSVAKEFLGDSSGSDLTPLDTDMSIILDDTGSISDIIGRTKANRYGDIYFVMKNDDRFITTRRSPSEDNKNIAQKADLSKLEVFYTGKIGDGHYGLRTGFASSEIDYIVSQSNDNRIGFEIARNGFYIPVVDITGKLIFTPEDYDKLREKMAGLKYYDEYEYKFSENLEIPEVQEIASQLELNKKEVEYKRLRINKYIKEVISNFNLEIKAKFDGDLTPGSIDLIDTGSTGRDTNMIGAGDFDFMIRLDKEIMTNPEKLSMIKEAFSEKFKPADIIEDNNGNLRRKGVTIEGLEQKVDIDITYVQKNNKLNYSTDMALKDRLSTIKEQDYEKYKLVIANIIYAKKVLKSAGVYKPHRSDSSQGGLGGVGVENWILQNGGSFIDAVRAFLRDIDSGKFQVWDFGENHTAFEKGYYPHDEFVSHNMSVEGIDKMKAVLSELIKNYDNNNVQVMEDNSFENNLDNEGVIRR
ncbi:MAG: hypothetical protein IJ574_03650 [Bacilli bacterium]|nr:hypothetical protein [Bacilli bacterium]